jgi:hypothetical protein
MVGAFLLMISVVFGAELSERLAEERFEKNNQTNVQQEKQIFVDFDPDAFVPFRERKQNWGFQLGLNYSNFQPSKQKSKIDLLPFSETIDEGIKAVGITIGSVMYTTLAGISAQIFYETGQAKSGRSGLQRKLEVQMFGAKAGFYFNNLFVEPFVVPYILGKVVFLGWAEAKNAEKKSGQNEYAVGTQLGALIQLNWLESDQGLNAQKYGLENTYLDLFVHQNNTSNSVNDPDFETNFDYGVGLLLEF